MVSRRGQASGLRSAFAQPLKDQTAHVMSDGPPPGLYLGSWTLNTVAWLNRRLCATAISG